MSSIKLDSAITGQLLSFGLDLALKYIERRAGRPHDQLTNEQILAAIRAERVESADALIDSGIGEMKDD